MNLQREINNKLAIHLPILNVMRTTLFIFLFSTMLFNRCDDVIETEKKITDAIQFVKQQNAPDGRVAIFSISHQLDGRKIALSGETDSKKAHEQFLDILKDLNREIVDKIRILPDTAVGNEHYAIARNSVINIRSKPKHSAELGTQGLLGMPLKVLDKKGDFYRVQTPDKYISWVDKGGITRMEKSEFDEWQSSPKVIFTQVFGYVYKDPSKNEIISDVTLGGLLQLNGYSDDFYKVAYPDGRQGFLSKNDGVEFQKWLQTTSASAENIEQIAKTMDGFPYLWGGTSSKGIDCSGFTKMVYLMNGFIIPRDASQQVTAGKTVDENLDFSDLQKGDLLFFGKKATETKKQRVTHVGIWLGNDKMEFIHASGNVHISSMDENQSNYDAFNKNRYLGSRRYLNVEDELIVPLKSTINIKP